MIRNLCAKSGKEASGEWCFTGSNVRGLKHLNQTCEGDRILFLLSEKFISPGKKENKRTGVCMRAFRYRRDEKRERRGSGKTMTGKDRAHQNHVKGNAPERF